MRVPGEILKQAGDRMIARLAVLRSGLR
jgi:hypothetical protein